MLGRSGKWLALSVLGTGTLLLVLGLWFSWTEMRFAAAAEVTPGTVVEAPAGGDGDPDRTFGRVAFQHRGERHVLTMEPGSGSGTLAEDAIVGDVQALLVAPGEPGRARTADFGNRYALKLVLVFFALIMLLFGAGAWFASRPLSGGDTTRSMALAFLALGVVMLGVGGGAAWAHKSWIERSIETIGVARYRENRVRVQLTDRQGRTWHARAPFLPDRLPPDRDYVTVPIRYDPERPWEIAPYALLQYWSTPLFLIGFALAWCAVPLLGLWLMWRWDRRRERERP